MPPRRTLSLALQGGGAHGAFTWGVLDALLEDGRIDIDAISATSAGAMNAVVLAQGWLDGGRDGARAALRRFWTALSGTMPIDVTRRDAEGGVHLAPAVKLWMMWAQYVAPSQFNPLDLNPLRELLVRQVDFERLRDASPLRLFDERELTVDSVLASGCLPTVFRAPRIDGELFWDGGYAGNPAVFPLLGARRVRDVLMVLLSPLEFAPIEDGASAADIRARIAEIGFTAAFRREMQAFARERADAAARGWLPRLLAGRSTPSSRARFHLIESRPALDHVTDETRLAVNLRFFEMLHGLGRGVAAQWLDRNFDALGRRDSIDLQARFA